MSDEKLREEVAALKADLASLREDIKRLGEAVLQATDERIKQATASLDEHAQAGKDEIDRKLEEALDRGEKTLHQLDEEVRRHPVGSLLTAFFVGLLISRVLDAGYKH